MERSTVEIITAGVFATWLGWISFEVVGIKSDKDVDQKINDVATELVRAVGAVSGNLNTEVELSKEKHDRAFGWLKFVNDTALENKGRLIELEVKERLQHGN